MSNCSGGAGQGAVVIAFQLLEANGLALSFWFALSPLIPSS